MGASDQLVVAKDGVACGLHNTVNHKQHVLSHILYFI
jgi:hypothetical protein